MTTELRVDGLDGRGGGLAEEVEVAVVDVWFEEDIDEVPGVPERAVSDVSDRFSRRRR